MSDPELDERLAETGVLAILRDTTGEHVVPVADELVRVGVRCIEVTANTPGAADALARLHTTHGSTVSLGLGTVRSASDVADAAAIGAGFVVAPGTDPAVGEAARAHGLGWYPGALTPTEIEYAARLGASAVKLFPAEPAGGPAYLRAIRVPLDDLALIPTGGVGIEAIGDYLGAGAAAVALGSPLIGDALRTGRVDDVGARARAALEAVARARAGS